MNFLEERIAKDGVICSEELLKVDSFLYHQLDIALVDAVAAEICRDGIIRIQHQHIVSHLEAEQVLFRIHILIHILMDIQMVGCQIGHHRHMGTTAHIHQLERAQLYHRKVCYFHLIQHR